MTDIVRYSRYYNLTYVDLPTQYDIYDGKVLANYCQPVLHLATDVACPTGDVTCKWPDQVAFRDNVFNLNTADRMIEFTTKDGVIDNIADVVSEGWEIVSYNQESGFEQGTTAQDAIDAAATVHANGKLFCWAPGRTQLESFAASVVPVCDFVHLQTQVFQDNAANLTSWLGTWQPAIWGYGEGNRLRSITGQVSTQRPVQAGKSMQVTLRSATDLCMSYLNGMSCFFGNTSSHTPDPIGELRSWVDWYYTNYLGNQGV